MVTGFAGKFKLKTESAIVVYGA